MIENCPSQFARGRIVGVAVGLLSLTCVQTGDLEAQPRSDETSEPPDDPKATVAAESGWERVAEDDYLSSALKFGLNLPVPELLCGDDDSEETCTTRFRAGLQLPLRLRLKDRAPFDSGTIRRADWDEPNDYLRTVRFVEYGDPDSSVRARLGELGSYSLGHGTIVNDYFNVVTPDQHRTGATFRLESPGGGVDAIVNDVVGPNMFGGRVHVRPLWFVDPESWWTRITLGTSVVADVSAPSELSRTSTEQPVAGPTRLPEVASSTTTAVGGIDLSVHLLDRDAIALVPYTDFNVHFGLGRGIHTGFQAEVDAIEAVALSGRFEFRSLSGRYLPDYFGPLYEIDRYQFFGWGVLLPGPKLRVAAERRSGPVLGGYGELTARLFDAAEFSAAYSEHEGPDNANLRLSLRMNPIDRVRLGAFYFKHNFDEFREIGRRQGTFLVTESRARIVGPLYVKGAYSLLWQLREDGVYRPIPRWNLGAGVSFAL